MTLAKMEPMPVPVQTFCYSVLKELGAPDFTFAPLNLCGYHLYWQRDRRRYYLNGVLLPKSDVSGALLGDWKRLRVTAVALVGWETEANLWFILRSPVQTEVFVQLHNPRQQDWATQTLITTLKGVIAASKIEGHFGIPYCVEFQDYSRGGLFGRLSVTIAWERLRKRAGLLLSCLDESRVVVTAMAGRKILGHIDPDAVLNGNWDAVKQWVGSVVLDGILLRK